MGNRNGNGDNDYWHYGEQQDFAQTERGACEVARSSGNSPAQQQ